MSSAKFYAMTSVIQRKHPPNIVGLDINCRIQLGSGIHEYQRCIVATV
jgi:hypothetical protein